MTIDAKPKRGRWFRRSIAFVALAVGIVAGLFWFESRRPWWEWEAACAEADRDDAGWRAAQFFAAADFRPQRPTLTASVDAVSAKLPAKRAAEWASSVERFLDADRRRRALLNCATVALAAERFRRDHNRWPMTLDELVAKYISAVPIDPFDFQLLRYRTNDDGAVIYSVGPDKADDQGDVAYWAKGVGFSMMGRSTKDIGLRLFDPTQRRQSP